MKHCQKARTGLVRIDGNVGLDPFLTGWSVFVQVELVEARQAELCARWVGSPHSPSEMGGPGSGHWEVFLEEGNLEGLYFF